MEVDITFKKPSTISNLFRVAHKKYYEICEKSKETDEGSSLNFTSNIKQILANWLISILREKYNES